MDRQQVIKALKDLKAAARQKYKAELKGVFGSFARGENMDKSDIDILVDFKEGATLFDLVDLSDFLEERLQRKVDVVSRRAIRKELESSIYDSMVYL